MKQIHIRQVVRIHLGQSGEFRNRAVIIKIQENPVIFPGFYQFIPVAFQGNFNIWGYNQVIKIIHGAAPIIRKIKYHIIIILHGFIKIKKLFFILAVGITGQKGVDFYVSNTSFFNNTCLDIICR